MVLLRLIVNISSFEDVIPPKVFSLVSSLGFEEFRPSQFKAVQQGLFDCNNLLVCTPTASGKTLVGELAFLNGIFERCGKAIYVVPLKALASEKYKEFRKKYPELKVVVSLGDLDSEDIYLETYDLIITTSEKLDSLLRHKAPWISSVNTLIVDEIHLLNDISRGPTLEVVITLLRMLVRELQIVGLSATIGNPEELASWLDAELVVDYWRPVRLKQGVFLDGKIKFIE